MDECPYCGSTFDDEGRLLDHLADEHEDELGPIDRRRIDAHRGDRDGPSLGTVAIVGIGGLVLLAVVLGAVFVLDGSSRSDGMRTPSNLGVVHEHGTMEVTIDGEELDFANDPRFIGADDFFHFHGGSNLWHVHRQGVTLEYALHTLGIEVTPDGRTVVFEGVTYDDADPDTTVTITVDGEPVNPREYVLEGVGPEDAARAGEGDDVVVIVERTD